MEYLALTQLYEKLFLYVIGSLIILPVYSQHLIKGTIIDSEMR